MGRAVRLAVIGAGIISAAYRETFDGRDDVAVVAVVDRQSGRAQTLADAITGARAMRLDDVLTDETIDTVVNLTIPTAHAEVSRAALTAGKHVYSEKPLGVDTDDGAALLSLATGSGRLGCAPDTVLGTGVQTARWAIEQGMIGRPVAAHAVMVTPGHERWHPNPEFYYERGGGPLMDMGPYYLSALIHLLGPVRSVSGRASRPQPVRRIGRGPRAGTEFTTMVDTHETALLEHESGALTTVLMSFDAVATTAPPIEVHGTEGSMTVPIRTSSTAPCSYVGAVTAASARSPSLPGISERPGASE